MRTFEFNKNAFCQQQKCSNTCHERHTAFFRRDHFFPDGFVLALMQVVMSQQIRYGWFMWLCCLAMLRLFISSPISQTEWPTLYSYKWSTSTSLPPALAFLNLFYFAPNVAKCLTLGSVQEPSEHSKWWARPISSLWPAYLLLPFPS